MDEEDDRLETHESELTVRLPADWDEQDMAALLRRAADELDSLGGVHVEQIRLDWTLADGDHAPTITLTYRLHRRPPGIPDHAAPMDIPIRDATGRIIGHRSRSGRGIVGHGS
jgi:hypothetical protein